LKEKLRARAKEFFERLTPVQRIAFLLLSVGLGTFILGYGITALAFTTGSAPSDVVLVPDVREMTVAEATRRMNDESLTLAVGDSLPNAAVKAGGVLAQSPLPGQEVAPGTEVRVIISTGATRPVVPNVAELPLATATQVLETAGFEVLVEPAPGEGSVGQIVGIVPSSGTVVTLPAKVTLRVGAEMPYLQMPSVMGMLEDSAKATVEGIGLRVSEVLYENSESLEPNRVVGQDPSAGDSIAEGSAVRLRVTLPQVIRPPNRGDGDRRDENRTPGAQGI
jgi:eukaryotic-like serine/threonine-protein kinase